MVSWRSEEHLPPANNDWESWRPPWGRRCSGEAAVRAALRRWHPWDPLLVATPGATKMLPPVCIAGLDRDVQARALFHYRLLLAALVLWTLGFGIGGFVSGAHTFTNAAVAGVLMFAYVFVVYAVVFKPLNALRESSRFVAWVYLSPMGPVRNVLIVMVLLGALQYWLQRRLGGLEPLIVQYGLVFDLAPAQPWRYAIGPLMHSGAGHWLANVSLLTIATALAGTIGKRTALAMIFAAGVILPAATLTVLPYEVRQDAFVGISGGALALMGWIVGVGWRERAWFPRHFSLNLGMFSLLFVALSSLLGQRTNDFVHVSGLLLGLIPGLMGLGWKFRSEAAG